jgi:hypothetical protein
MALQNRILWDYFVGGDLGVFHPVVGVHADEQL